MMAGDGIHLIDQHNGVHNAYIDDGWFIEKWKAYGMTYKVEEILHEEESAFQKILVLKTVGFGNVLVLDGITQCSEKDEFVYQEMIAHVPLNCHPNPENVLIIGGGDGGVLREVLKHSCVKNVTLCEIDKRVIELSKKYLPTMSISLDHPKAKVIVGDGYDHVKINQCQFDVIITDSSDPIGPNEVLFRSDYGDYIKACLKPNGIVCCQGESIWLDAETITTQMKSYRKLFPVVQYCSLYLPTYPSGQIGLLLAAISEDVTFDSPLREFTDKEINDYDLKYYSSEIHRASFVLPKYMKKILEDSITS